MIELHVNAAFFLRGIFHGIHEYLNERMDRFMRTTLTRPFLIAGKIALLLLLAAVVTAAEALSIPALCYH